jgi:Winged helix DNA-binding domain
VRSLDDAELIRWRAGSSLLTARAASLHEAVGTLLALQAQELSAFRLSVRARTEAAVERDVVAALEAPATLVRTWAMRGTLHLVAASDARWLVALFGPRFRAATTRRRTELGIPDARCESALPLLQDILSGGPLPRAEIVAGLNERGFAITMGTQAVPHLMGYAAAGGLICCGPGETFALTEQWLAADAEPPPPDPLAELARRYLTGHSPADAGDLAAWSGLPLTQARAAFTAIDDELHWWKTSAGAMATLTENPLDKGVSPTARLLPRYDGYLLGWRDRSLVLDDRHRRAIHPGGGVLNAALTIDGVVRGAWSTSSRAKSLTLTVRSFSPLKRQEIAAAEADAADVSRFLERDVELVIRAGD